MSNNRERKRKCFAAIPIFFFFFFFCWVKKRFSSLFFHPFKHYLFLTHKTQYSFQIIFFLKYTSFQWNLSRLKSVPLLLVVTSLIHVSLTNRVKYYVCLDLRNFHTKRIPKGNQISTSLLVWLTVPASQKLKRFNATFDHFRDFIEHQRD